MLPHVSGRAPSVHHRVLGGKKTLAALQLQCVQVFCGFTLARVVFVQLMEQRWRDRALTRSREALEERELLSLNPINWSGTLK